MKAARMKPQVFLVFTFLAAASYPVNSSSWFNPNENSRCSVIEFECSDGSACIDIAYKCDGDLDCTDGSDEKFCQSGAKLCPFGHLPCKDGSECFLEAKICDGYTDCADGSDEKVSECTNPRPEVLPQSSPSDHNGHDSTYSVPDAQESRVGSASTGDTTSPAESYNYPTLTRYHEPGAREVYIDTSDNSWQQQYHGPASVDGRRGGGETSCRSYEFQCTSNRKCLDMLYYCDGRSDCPDGSDEQGCPNQSRSSSSTSRGEAEQPSGSSSNYYPPSPYGHVTYDVNPSRSQPQPEVESAPTIKVATYDTPQTVIEGNDVVFRCRDESLLRTDVYWTRPNGSPLPANANDVNGRLTIVSLRDVDSGVYECHARGSPSNQATVHLNVVQAKSLTGAAQPSPVWPMPQPDPQPSWTTKRPSYYEAPYVPMVTQPPPTMVQPEVRTLDARSQCRDSEISCRNGIQCIQRHQVCDTRKDCDDSSDEMSCPVRCISSQFKCDNLFQCIEKRKRCDGYSDCHDGSDERFCENRPVTSGSLTLQCGIASFRCSSGTQCIPWSYLCDGFYDCKDGSDEMRQCQRPSMIEAPPREIEARKGESVSLTCRASGYPKPAINWRYNMDVASGNWPKISLCTSCSNCSGTEALSSITLIEFDENMEGKWTCEAINSMGSTLSQHDSVVTLGQGHKNARHVMESHQQRSSQVSSPDLYNKNK